MGLGDVISKTVSVGAKQPVHSSLEDFLSYFNNPSGAYSRTIDPMSTFDVEFRFRPNLDDMQTADARKAGGKPDTGLVAGLASAGKQALKNAANNITGGLWTPMESDYGSAQKEFEQDNVKQGFITALEYMIKANSFQQMNQYLGDGSDSDALRLQMGMYIQKISLPQLTMEDSAAGNDYIGQFPVNGRFVKPSQNNFNITVVNTKASLIERIFYPWLRECTLPVWSYATQPYTTADITVDFTKHNDVKYVFCGCRPKQIYSIDADQGATGTVVTRDVTMLFDYMFVVSDLNVNDEWTDKLLGSGQSIHNGVAKMFNV